MELLSISDEKDREAVEDILNKYRAERRCMHSSVWRDKHQRVSSATGATIALRRCRNNHISVY
ncbi:hypothetical protein FAM3257_01053 [Lacticaseibacillus paracasei]|nr:hypothetical protein FAM3257_01053 [Lacticaseibacillus paracasei]